MVRGVAHRCSLVGPAGHQLACVLIAGVQAAAAQAGREGLGVAWLSVQNTAGTPRSRAKPPISARAVVALRGAVIRDVAADHDQVQARQVPAVVQELLEHDTGVEPVRFRSAVARRWQSDSCKIPMGRLLFRTRSPGARSPARCQAAPWW